MAITYEEFHFDVRSFCSGLLWRN